jgi:hypothetical protein
MKKRKILFCNEGEEGDIHMSRAYVQQLINLQGDCDYYYHHRHGPGLLADIEKLKYAPKMITADSTINIWIGQYSCGTAPGVPLTGHHFTHYYEVMRQVYNNLNLSQSLKPPMCYLPSIDYKYFGIDNVDKYFEKNKQAHFLICNDDISTHYAPFVDFGNIIEVLAKTHPEVVFLTSKKNPSIPKINNIKFCEDVIGGDFTEHYLNQVSYISSKCYLVVGKPAGSYLFAVTNENYQSGKFLCICNSERDMWWLDGRGETVWVFDGRASTIVAHVFQAINDLPTVYIENEDKKLSLFQQQLIQDLDYMYKVTVQANIADGSYAGEYIHLDKLFSEIGIHGGYVVDVAASDGFTQSSTLGFFKRPGWSGLAVEMDPKKFATLAFIYASFPQAHLARSRVTPFNIKSLLETFEVPTDFDLLNLDIDSYDLHVMESLLKARFRPKVISMEINEKVPPPIYFTVDYSDSHIWEMDHFFGCSLVAAATVVKPFGYILQNLVYNNAIFVRSDISPGKVSDMNVDDAYLNGYKNAPDRSTLFPWNKDVDCLLEYSAEKSYVFLENYFMKYRGKYTMRL